MSWKLPLTIEIDGVNYAIRNKCDFRVVLDVIVALNDDELEMEYRIQCALFIFYEDLTGCKSFETAVSEMYKIISYGSENDENENCKPKLMDWKHDFMLIAPPISRVLGYSVRDENTYTHWYDFIGAYMEIGECSFASVVSIRNKRVKGKKLEKHEQEFYKEHKKLIELPFNLTNEEKEWLDSDC